MRTGCTKCAAAMMEAEPWPMLAPGPRQRFSQLPGRMRVRETWAELQAPQQVRVRIAAQSFHSTRLCPSKTLDARCEESVGSGERSQI